MDMQIYFLWQARDRGIQAVISARGCNSQRLGQRPLLFK